MLQKEVMSLQDTMTHEMKVDRIHVVQMKSSIAERRADIANEMKHIKRIMTMLFEQESTFEG